MRYEWVLINTANSNTMGVYETEKEAQLSLDKWKAAGYPGIITRRVKGEQ